MVLERACWFESSPGHRTVFKAILQRTAFFVLGCNPCPGLNFAEKGIDSSGSNRPGGYPFETGPFVDHKPHLIWSSRISLSVYRRYTLDLQSYLPYVSMSKRTFIPISRNTSINTALKTFCGNKAYRRVFSNNPSLNLHLYRYTLRWRFTLTQEVLN